MTSRELIACTQNICEISEELLTAVCYEILLALRDGCQQTRPFLSLPQLLAVAGKHLEGAEGETLQKALLILEY
jgi:hypothetical protein